MSDIKTAILNAAERRMQFGGFGGFSFREIAADVGIKSSSVHYHFPTKENRAAAGATAEKPGPRFRVDQCVPPDRRIGRAYLPMHRPRRRLARFAAGSGERGERVF